MKSFLSYQSALAVVMLSLAATWLAAEDALPVFEPDTTLHQPTVIAADGLAVFEAESYYGQRAGTDVASDVSWVPDTLIEGWSGTTSLAALPNNGAWVGDTDKGPGLDYAVKLDEGGTWYAWIRLAGISGNDDSAHIAINDTIITAGGYGMTSSRGDWRWVNSVSNKRVSFEASEAGIYKLTVRMREDGTRIDRLILTKDPNYAPASANPVNSTVDVAGGSATFVMAPYGAVTDADFTDEGLAFGPQEKGVSYGWTNGTPVLMSTGLADATLADVVSLNGGTWEVAVPNGVYDVEVTAAGPANELRAHDLMIEGFYQPDVSPAAQSTVITATVSVSDGRLTIAPAAGAINPAIASVTITRNEEAIPAEDSVAHGLLGAWYDHPDFLERKRLAVDPRIKFYWGGRSPWPGMHGELFAARWEGFLVADETAVHNLNFRFNESCRVWINGQQVVDAWYHGKTWYNKYADVSLTAGQPVPIVVEYRQRFRSSGIRMLWKPTPGEDAANKDTAYTHIPTGNLLPPTDSAAPTIPESVHLSFLSDTRVQISWAPSTDDVNVLGYHIHRDGVRVATVLHESIWIDEDVTPSTTPRYTVEAIDWNGSLSGPSAIAETWHSLEVASTELTSHTSPAWFEGTSAPATQSIELSVNGAAAIPALRLGPDFWGTDAQDGKPYGIELSKTAPSAVTVTATGPNGELAEVDLTVSWTPLLLDYANDPKRYAVRAGDTLLVDVAEAAGTAVAYDINDDGVIDAQGVAGSPVELPFNAPAVTVIRVLADADNDGEFDEYAESVRLLEVTTLAVDFDGPIASEVGFQREKGVEVLPLIAAKVPVWDVNSSAMLSVSAIPDDELSQEVLDNPDYNPANYGRRLYIEPHQRGTGHVLARTPSGVLIEHQEIDEFTHEIDAIQGLLLSGETESGKTRYAIRPYIPNLDTHFNMFGHSSTFEGGLTDMVINTSSPRFAQEFDVEAGEVIGVLRYEIEMPDGEDSYCFKVRSSQTSSHGTWVTTSSGVNSSACKVDRYLSLLFIKAKDDVNGGFADEQYIGRIWNLLSAAEETGSPPKYPATQYHVLQQEKPTAHPEIMPSEVALFKDVANAGIEIGEAALSEGPGNKEKSDCKACDHECEALTPFMHTGTIPHRYSTEVARCGTTSDAKKNGGFEVAALDASELEDVCPMPARPGSAVLPYIRIVSGGQDDALYGVVCKKTNVFEFKAGDHSTANPAHNFRPAQHRRVWNIDGGTLVAGTLGDVAAGVDGTESITVEFPVGRHFPRLEIYTKETTPRRIGHAAIHSIVVEDAESDNVVDRLETYDFGVNPLAAGGAGMDWVLRAETGGSVVDSRLQVDPNGAARVRVSLDGYPQNEYKVGPSDTDDSKDLAQVVQLTDGVSRQVYVQGYLDWKSDFDAATKLNKEVVLQVQGQALIEVCSDPCNKIGDRPVNAVWQLADNEKFNVVNPSDTLNRPSYTALTPKQQRRYMEAVSSLDAVGEHAKYADIHGQKFGDGIHWTSHFLPWHRAFIDDYETDLQRINPCIALPTWDWGISNNPVADADNTLFTTGFMGSGTGTAIDGLVGRGGPNGYGCWTEILLRPRQDQNALSGLNDINLVLGLTQYDVPPFDRRTNPFGSYLSSFSAVLEGSTQLVGQTGLLHAGAHVYVGSPGGQMASHRSPMDPVFFLHHAYIDKVWADWENAAPAGGPARTYIPAAGTGEPQDADKNMAQTPSGVYKPNQWFVIPSYGNNNWPDH